VDQTIAHAGHCTPFDLGVLRAEVVRHAFARFADDFDAPRERALQRRVGEEARVV
jgi:hypothetical protein